MLGRITSLRLCYKPSSSSKILDLVGRKSTDQLLPGQSCLLFIKLHIPRIRPSRSTHADDIDQASLFAEIQSIVGTLEQDILHIEARYKHSLVHQTNTVTCRTTCKLRRPKTDSRWSICSSIDGLSSRSNVHEKLARYITHHCPPQQALDLIHYHLGATNSAKHPIDRICESLETQLHSAALDATDKPSILISDTSLETNSPTGSPAPSDHYSTAPCSPTSDPRTTLAPPPPPPPPPPLPPLRQPTAHLKPPSHHPSPATTTTALSPPASTEPDNARALWKHIRQSSLSRLQQLVDAAPETLERLEASDEVVRELRRRALANKRSVGAETLRAWRWDEGRGGAAGGVGPWM